MSRNDLRVDEKRWRRKSLFRKRTTYTATRLVIFLLILATLALLGWSLEILPFAQAETLLP